MLYALQVPLADTFELVSFFDGCSTPGGTNEKLGRTNLVVSGILTGLQSVKYNNSIWKLDAGMSRGHVLCP